MNFGYAFEALQYKTKALAEEAEQMLLRYLSACDQTASFLKLCEDAGLKEVAIGVAHESVPSSMDFTFGPANSVFAMGRTGSWPTIWGVVDKAGISSGCGNSDQHQCDLDNLVNGTYHLRDGKWAKVD